jgi:protein SCO1/2
MTLAIFPVHQFLPYKRVGGNPESMGSQVFGTVPPFTLEDQDGASFDSSRLAGKVWVASFIFTSCGASCPVMAAKLRRLQDALVADPLLEEKTRLVAFSVDPERDTPARLKEFAERHGAQRGFWWFLTGEKGAVVRLSREGFHLAAESPGADAKGGAPAAAPDAATHSDRFVLVDQEGRLRGYYRPAEEEADQDRLLRDLKRLVAEAAASR